MVYLQMVMHILPGKIGCLVLAHPPGGVTMGIPSGTLLYFLLFGVTGSYPTSILNCEIEQVNFYDTYTLPPLIDNSYATSYAGASVYYETPVPYMVTQGPAYGFYGAGKRWRYSGVL